MLSLRTKRNQITTKAKIRRKQTNEAADIKLRQFPAQSASPALEQHGHLKPINFIDKMKLAQHRLML